MGGVRSQNKLASPKPPGLLGESDSSYLNLNGVRRKGPTLAITYDG